MAWREASGGARGRGAVQGLRMRGRVGVTHGHAASHRFAPCAPPQAKLIAVREDGLEGRVLQRVKTPVVADDCNPSYNFTTTVDVPPDMASAHLRLSVMDQDLGGIRNEFIGPCWQSGTRLGGVGEGGVQKRLDGAGREGGRPREATSCMCRWVAALPHCIQGK